MLTKNKLVYQRQLAHKTGRIKPKASRFGFREISSSSNSRPYFKPYNCKIDAKGLVYKLNLSPITVNKQPAPNLIINHQSVVLVYDRLANYYIPPTKLIQLRRTVLANITAQLSGNSQAYSLFIKWLNEKKHRHGLRSTKLKQLGVIKSWPQFQRLLTEILSSEEYSKLAYCLLEQFSPLELYG